VSDIFTPSRLVDLAIAWIILEALIVSIRYRFRGNPAAALWSLANSAAGLLLLLAARFALAGSDLVWVILCLAGALLAHLGEWSLRARLLGKPART